MEGASRTGAAVVAHSGCGSRSSSIALWSSAMRRASCSASSSLSAAARAQSASYSAASCSASSRDGQVGGQGADHGAPQPPQQSVGSGLDVRLRVILLRGQQAPGSQHHKEGGRAPLRAGALPRTPPQQAAQRARERESVGRGGVAHSRKRAGGTPLHTSVAACLRAPKSRSMRDARRWTRWAASRAARPLGTPPRRGRAGGGCCCCRLLCGSRGLQLLNTLKGFANQRTSSSVSFSGTP